MKALKTVWRSIGIPLALFKTVNRLIVQTGDPSVAERREREVAETFSFRLFFRFPIFPKYVRVAVRQRINRDEVKLLADEF